MTEQKQIEEMAKDICRIGKPCEKCSAYPDACKAVKPMRERLIELIESARYWGSGTSDEIADHLLANGVIVLPCKVGDIVYSLTECSCEDIDGVHTECEFYGYGEDDRVCTIPNGAKCPNQYRIVECYVTEMNILWFTRNWCVTVFLTREEAEKALKEAQDDKQ